LRGDLDRANHLERIQEIRFCAQGFSDKPSPNMTRRSLFFGKIPPVGQVKQPVRQQIVGWVKRFAKPIAVVPNMMGIASAFAR
jgi:hypothetical protein